MEKLVEVCEPAEVRIEFTLNSKCRATVQLKSLHSTTPIAFKIQTSSPNKFLVNPPSGLIPPLSISTFQVILKPQPNLPPSYPRSPTDRFLIKTAEFASNSSDSTHPDSINSWFASRPYGFSTYDIKLKVAFIGSFLLCDAVSRADLETVRSLIKRQRSVLSGLSPHESNSLLRVASELANPDDMVHLLLEAGLRIHETVRSDNNFKHPDYVHMVDADIVQHVEDVEHGELVLEASRNGNVSELETLLRRGVNFNYRDDYGLTAVHAAAFKGHKDVVLMLCKAGLDLECEDDEGHVPLHMAVESGDLETVRIFVDKGVNVNAMNKKGVTPLYLARVWGHEDVCELLVGKGAFSTLSLALA
ncbi:unnamed protein product [Vicia faba]|uniref:MSP domain-containing protein n=1 Tax=Vicia faba TaxID=3906 RepID=A0AAV0YQN8_VICFA|nr:unnamed protein product [Vicia faba]